MAVLRIITMENKQYPLPCGATVTVKKVWTHAGYKYAQVRIDDPLPFAGTGPSDAPDHLLDRAEENSLLVVLRKDSMDSLARIVSSL